MKRIKPTILVATIVWMGAAPAFGAPAEGLPDADQKELATLVGQLADPARSGQTKLEAAEMLLTKPYPRATEALKGFLSGINQTARIAICQAITHGGRADKSFIQPLLDMLTGKDKVLRPPAARALATYRDHGVTDKLVAIVRDRKRERGVRVVTISALQSILDKRTVDALVHLLDDPDAAVRDASADALAKLTNIKAFRTDIGLAKRWWDRNRNKAPSEWLTALADSLARSKTELEADNVRLRRRLAQALRDLYNATAPGQRQALLMGFLSDPLGDVRLAGADVMEEKIAAGEKVSQKVSDRILGMLGDSDWRVRKASALLVGHQGDAKALGALLESLTDEKTPDVRQAIMTGLGQLRMAEALEVVLVEVSSKYDRVAGAAAVALGRIAAAHPLKGDRLAEASAALIKRYYRGGGRAETVPLREAILTAMGALGQKDFLPVLRAAIKDDEATVRLAGVNALALLGGGPDAEPIASLVGDSDRGVRRAAIAALGVLGGPEHLATILQRTDPRNETDETVRQKAWEVAMHLLAEADADVLETQAQQLADRSEAIKQRIEILQMLVSARKAQKSKRLPLASRRLGLALLQASRPAEAAGYLRQAYEALAAAKDKIAGKVWVEWISALLATDNPAAIRAMIVQGSDTAFSAALVGLSDRLKTLMKAGDYAPAILLGGRTLDNLAHRLTVAQREGFQKLVAEAKTKQQAADRQRVSQLVAQLTARDKAVRDKAAAEIQTMGPRAVVGLLDALRTTLEGQQPKAEVEQAILAVLKQIAPKLTGYDPAAPKAERVKQIEAWLEAWE